LLSRTGPSESVTSASNERSYERWEELFREKMAADLEFATYIKGLEPGTGPAAHGEGPRSLAQAPGATLEKEAREGAELVTLMNAHCFENTQLWEAVERGEVTLPESAIELLLRIGAIEERR
jgi:hypothetical protein